jgi:phosphoenolpyruvate---glycerone phosphotransferase subunit DhaL
MKETTISAQDWVSLLSQVAVRIEAEKDHLNDLDGAIGDGDHGVTMAIGFRSLRKSLTELQDDVTIDLVFQTAGQAFLLAAGGAVGPLIGTMLSDTGKAFKGRVTFGAEEAVWMLEIMEQALVRRGKAQPGDKTMLDALHPAVIAARAAEGEDMIEIIRRAADAAAVGARATSGMVSRVGRSSRLGERTLGHEDPGANSIALILRVLEEEVAAL